MGIFVLKNQFIEITRTLKKISAYIGIDSLIINYYNIFFNLMQFYF